MIYAIQDGNRVPATPRSRGTCPLCGGETVAKCGPITVWHWAHRAVDCDEWAEPDSQWHTDWQSRFPVDSQEVPIGNHRADVFINGTVVEIQHSGISATEMRQRERHYGAMIWIFDARAAIAQDRLDIRINRNNPELDYRTFRWKHPRRSLGVLREPVYLDLGGDVLLRLGRIYTEAPCGGWGHATTGTALVDALHGSSS